VSIGSSPPTWIERGATVAYYAHQGSEEFHVGIVDSQPRLLNGTTWVVALRDMEPTYRDGRRRTVPAAACNCLKPYDLTAEYARERAERIRLWASDRREQILRKALERICALAEADGLFDPESWEIANEALRAAEALQLEDAKK